MPEFEIPAHQRFQHDDGRVCVRAKFASMNVSMEAEGKTVRAEIPGPDWWWFERTGDGIAARGCGRDHG